MSSLSIADLEERSGMKKQPGETAAEYLRRVGKETDLPAEDVEAVIDAAVYQQFSPESSSMTSDAPVEELIEMADIIEKDDKSTQLATTDSEDSHSNEVSGSVASASPPSQNTISSGNSTDNKFRRSIIYPAVLILGVVVLAAGVLFVGGGQLPATDAGPESTDGEPEPDAADEPVDSAADAEGSLEVSEMAVDASLPPEEEFVELTNVGDATLDMSDWTVRDREGGAVDTRDVEPATFPDGFSLEPGESVQLVTGPGEDTADTVHWGSETRNWHEDGDVIVVLDGDDEEVLASEYGSPP